MVEVLVDLGKVIDVSLVYALLVVKPLSFEVQLGQILIQVLQDFLHAVAVAREEGRVHVEAHNPGNGYGHNGSYLVTHGNAHDSKE